MDTKLFRQLPHDRLEQLYNYRQEFDRMGYENTRNNAILFMIKIDVKFLLDYISSNYCINIRLKGEMFYFINFIQFKDVDTSFDLVKLVDLILESRIICNFHDVPKECHDKILHYFFDNQIPIFSFLPKVLFESHSTSLFEFGKEHLADFIREIALIRFENILDNKGVNTLILRENMCLYYEYLGINFIYSQIELIPYLYFPDELLNDVTFLESILTKRTCLYLGDHISFKFETHKSLLLINLNMWFNFPKLTFDQLNWVIENLTGIHRADNKFIKLCNSLELLDKAAPNLLFVIRKSKYAKYAPIIFDNFRKLDKVMQRE